MILKNENIFNFTHDALRVTKDGSQYINVNVIDNRTYMNPALWLRAHIDAWQIIPKNEHVNGQYSLAAIKDISFKFCSVTSQSHIQCIFIGDGLVDGFEASNNVFTTKSAHKITLNGAVGRIVSQANFCIDSKGNKTPVTTVLNPARIGGHKNVWILDFKNTYSYEPAKGCHIQDNRLKEQSRGTNLINFDYDKFMGLVGTIPDETPTSLRVDRLADFALLCGDKV